MVITGDTLVEAEYTPIDYTIRYVLSTDETIELARQENAHYGDVPEAVTLSTVLDTDNDGSYDYYLLNWVQPTDTITGDNVIPVEYEAYDDVLEVKITSADGEAEHYLSKVGNTITLPSIAAELEDYEFVGWGHINSGGYADPNVKEGSDAYTDYTPDYYTNGILYEFAPGETVTLTDELRLSDTPRNFKFIAIYV